MGKGVVNIILTIGALGTIIAGIWLGVAQYQYSDYDGRASALESFDKIWGTDKYGKDNDEHNRVNADKHLIQRNISAPILIVSLILLCSGIYLKNIKKNSDIETIAPQTEILVAKPVYASIPAPDSADELRKYKQLLDDGIITQEDFDAKKRQLLGI